MNYRISLVEKKHISYYYSRRVESRAEPTQLKLSSFNYRARLARVKLARARAFLCNPISN
jgi:hypothetical protein